MSELIKPEHECPFDPKQYQCDCFIAPMGSFSWALIQLKLRKRVTRSTWINCQGNNEMYLAITPRVNDLTVEKDSAYSVDGVTVGTQYDYLTHIDLRNDHGNFVPWQPTQEDMMACDWVFFEDKVKLEPEVNPEPIPEPKPEPDTKPEFNPDIEFRLKGKLTVGAVRGAEEGRYDYFGYANKIGDINIGNWEEISNNTPIQKLEGFYSKKLMYNPGYIEHMAFSLNTGSENLTKVQKEFYGKKLKIWCLDKEYDFSNSHFEYSSGLYYSEGNNYHIDKLESLFREHLGETLEIEFIWK
jgi:hypothetical protein